MEGGPLSEEGFKGFSEKVVPFLHVTSRVEGAKNPDLMAKKGGAGYPYICFLNAQGDVIAKPSYNKLTVEGFQETLADEVRAYLDLKQKAAAGDEQAALEFFIMRFELGALSVSALQGAMDREGFLDEAQIARVRNRLIEVQTRTILDGIDYAKPETFGPIAEKLRALLKRTGLPEGTAGINPWLVIMEDAYLRKDPDTFELAFTALKAAGMNNERFVSQRQKQLDEIRK